MKKTLLENKTITEIEFNQLLDNYKKKIAKLDINKIRNEAEQFEKLFNIGQKIDYIRFIFEESVEKSIILSNLQTSLKKSNNTYHDYVIDDVNININGQQYTINYVWVEGRFGNAGERYDASEKYLRMYHNGKLVIDGELSYSFSDASYRWLSTFKPGSWILDWYNLAINVKKEEEERIKEEEERIKEDNMKQIKDNFID
jgi:hypothetical protein